MYCRSDMDVCVCLKYSLHGPEASHEGDMDITAYPKFDVFVPMGSQGGTRAEFIILEIVCECFVDRCW